MQRKVLSTAGAELLGLTNVNIILGRNGAGKSRFLRSLDYEFATQPEFNVRYVSPERAGVFKTEARIQNAMANDKNWLSGVRRTNQAENFKAASANLLRDIELIYLRKMSDNPSIRNDPSRNFRTDRLEQINRLLSNLHIEQQDTGFVFISNSGDLVPPEQISSGESEAIALATEIMYFFETLNETKFNVLLLDEPDVHLHPDLQARLASFILGQVKELSFEVRQNVTICIATHSTPLVCALASSEFTSIGTKDFGASKVQLLAASQQLKKVAPFFGHSLSLSLSNDALLILEGEDDERVWQQATRSSQGSIRLFPVLANTVDQQSELETFCAPLLYSLYENPVAYSLRDGDGTLGDLQPTGPVVRFRLHCYAIENTLVTNECLTTLGTTWPEFQQAANEWIVQNSAHPDSAAIKEMTESSDRMQHKKIKQIRQLICAIAGTKKPWEIVVGQSIAALNSADLSVDSESLATYIGHTALHALLGTRLLPRTS